MASRWQLLWHTVRYLRPVQIYGRLWFRLTRPRVDTSPAPRWRKPQKAFIQQALHAPCLLDEETFRFLNEIHSLSEMGGWDAPTVPKLWRYNLHYFDDLRAAHTDDRKEWQRTLLKRWVNENPPSKGTGWEPYPTSLRVVNWLIWHLLGNELPEACVQSLAVQVRWLSRRLEYHLGGNHLWANAKALIFAGTCFEGEEARNWLRKGLSLLRQELREQILPDGGHFERSPMYHAVVLADLLDILALANTYSDVFSEEDVSAWQESAGRMLQWLSVMTHPDGEIALFNDAAFGIAPNLPVLEDYARRLGIEKALRDDPAMQDLADSGYVRMEAGPAILIADVGPIGPDYIPGHAHADTLSFELSVFGRRVVVDSGTSRYDVSPQRLRQRGTSAHNTVEIDGANSSEVWSSFRVARRARPFDKKLFKNDGVMTLECAHDGYRRLVGKPVHRRRWRLSPHGIMVDDYIDGLFHTAIARYHFHPDVIVEVSGDHAGRLILPNGLGINWEAKGARAVLTTSQYHPEFNVSLPRPCLELSIERQSCQIAFSWSK